MCGNKEISNKYILYLNNKKVNFEFKYKFSQKGKNGVKIRLKNILNNMSYMFSDCSYLTYLNLSNFNTNNVYNILIIYLYDITLTKLI